DNRTPRTWIRHNPLRIDREELEKFLSDRGIDFTRSDILDQFYQIESAADLIGSDPFSQGWFSFQDIAAGLVASLVDPKAGDTVLDACSAPGGKLACIAEHHGPNLKMLYALDASESRLQKVKDNIQRLGLGPVKVERSDVSKDVLPQTEWTLVDVPCSGTGVLGRRADARWRKQLEDIGSLGGIQRKILRNAWKHLRPGGSMIYATCSLEPEENWMMVDSVLKDLENAELVPIQAQKLEAYVDERGALSTLPWRDDMDGMFAVILRKIS
ncbi:RsmB/NOP family class I SAM-dependent RNA methyltransferase, partial [Magnetococcales bacterium HHB-1]